MLVGAFEIHHHLAAAVGLALDMGESRKVPRVFQYKGMRRAGIEPDVENIVDFLPALIGELAEEAFARTRRVPGIGALVLEGLDDADVDLGILQDVDRTVWLLPEEQRDRHTPGALARDYPIGPALDHAGDAVLAGRRHPARRLDRGQRAMPQRVVVPLNILIHRNEPLRRIAEYHRLLGAPRMRVLMLQARAREQHAGVDQSLDHRLVGVALLALLGEYALAGKAGRMIGKPPISIDRIGYPCIDMTRS